MRMPSGIILISLLCCSTGFATEFFVSPQGKDNNPGDRRKPFGSFNRAQEAVRAEREAHPESGVTVTFEGGVYHLQQPLQFDFRDSGASGERPVLYRARAGARVILSGGRAIAGWKADPLRPGVWKAKAGDPSGTSTENWKFDQLFVAGRRAVRA